MILRRKPKPLPPMVSKPVLCPSTVDEGRSGSHGAHAWTWRTGSVWGRAYCPGTFPAPTEDRLYGDWDPEDYRAAYDALRERSNAWARANGLKEQS